MSLQLLQKLDNTTRVALPFAIALVSVFLSVIAVPFPYVGEIMPPLPLIIVYWWVLYRSDLFGAGSAFVVGMFFDLVHFIPLGLSALLFVGMQQMIVQQRRFFMGQTFLMIWAGFSVTCVMVMALQWLLLCIIRWYALPVLPVVMQILFAVGLFPLMCLGLMRLQRLLPRQD